MRGSDRIRRGLTSPPSKGKLPIHAVADHAMAAHNRTLRLIPKGAAQVPQPVTPSRIRSRQISRKAPLGERLVARGDLDPGDLAKALALQARQDVRLGEILRAQNMVSDGALHSALAEQWRIRRVDLQNDPPRAELIARLGAVRCLSMGVVPWRDAGGVIFVATAHPERFEEVRPVLTERLGPVTPVLASREEIEAAIAQLASNALIDAAETSVPPPLSCRGWRPERAARWALAALVMLVACIALAPAATFAVLTLCVVLTLIGTMALKGAALAHGLRRCRASATRSHGVRPTPLRLPVVSIMVPLFHEEDIAAHLVERLTRITYPKELTDIVLLTEADDTTTGAALSRARLPRHFRVLSVPSGTVQTKPRALNYGLPFCRGQIVGIWDAEDAPAPGQLHDVVSAFAASPPEVACLQGVLDFYNARRNWLSRCFAIEYAVWFRAMLPGLQALRLPIPLGGTTLFFRRKVLEELAGWDAHNVTEDADLGLRLARAGYRTEMLDTTTREEANCRTLPWVRQRSRWLKGYAMTWGVHMRSPRALWNDLGPRGFIGMNILFLGTLCQFVLAPVSLSFWLLPFGLPHPLSHHLAPWAGVGLVLLFLLSEAISLALAAAATRGPDHRFLLKWAPTLHLYFPLAALASYKALWEILRRPFWWDKTAHGQETEDAPEGSHVQGGAAQKRAS